MFQPMLQNKLSLVALLVASSLLSACGDSTTNIVEKEPIAGDDGDDHDHDHDEISSVGRLVISAKDSNLVSVYELEDGSLLDSFAVADTPSALAASAGKRYALVVQRTTDRVEFVDGGLFQEDHVDHLHDYQQAPALSSFVLSESRPTHITSTDSQTAVFFDGDGNSSTPAAVAVITDADISTDSNGYPVLHYTTHMHGAAQARGEYVLSTIRDANSATTLPDKVGLYHAHDDHFHEEMVFTETCPGLHGSAQNEHVIAFGCTDGVLVIAQQGETFTASKIANTDDFSGTMRIGTLVGAMHAEHLVGFAGSSMFAIHAEDGEMDLVDWQGGEGAGIIGYGFADKGEKFVLLDNQGYLTILNYHGHEHDGAAAAEEPAFEFAAKVQLTSADVSTMPSGSRFELAISASDDKVYVANPIDSTLLTVDIADAEVVATKQLNFVPHKLVWLGIAEAAAAHDH
ncbi:MAG: 5-methyltetrahydrofolate--homocysteine methyltransferase [Gammaproteobacteria bacterium]|nr:5-methyltetrahydrofolate--homocysteine methyltransferase [Gammaproteobacteria bacterium]MBU1554875.1 5-methyltetrahydrofolate--homocysteine methyltransferase [Gammaproteobacteria bacterium]MBU2070988.1 5-methyltetrahydrofolate--homocysteine methyltransferase [Gammaproteobacteria bacterium]MBU2183814.1 5-methyltetrahydrofolate--homocysteine methyltransferase [Gammaproteobacteria bacterium]MBU2206487.1 5-methyltetrahydrofolate--homocysteine methyltransferase [Gammaproteobacteria bacterium]